MPFTDLLLHLDTYPDPTPAEDIDAAVAFAAAVGGRLTAFAPRVTIRLESNPIADLLVGLSEVVRGEEERSGAASVAGLAAFSERARARGVLGDAQAVAVDLYDVGTVVARHARTHDLCLVPLGGRFTGQRDLAQTVIFESGRPALIIPGGRPAFSKGLVKVAIAWDGGPFAARAVAEALPLLGLAGEVRVLSIVGEKASVHAGAADDLIRHLAAHEIAAAVDEVPARGRRIGEALDAYIADQAPDLLVMGAYGHSRVREFILGGATEHVLWETKVPTLLSH